MPLPMSQEEYIKYLELLVRETETARIFCIDKWSHYKRVAEEWEEKFHKMENFVKSSEFTLDVNWESQIPERSSV